MAKLRITAVEGAHTGQVLEAQYNPQEIVVDRAIPWKQQLHKGPGDLEFEKAEPARMFFELLFDEAKSSKSIQPLIDRLIQFGSVDGDLHRPPKVKVVWAAPRVRCRPSTAIEVLSVHYVMFTESSAPVRATVEVGLKQVGHLSARTA